MRLPGRNFFTQVSITFDSSIAYQRQQFTSKTMFTHKTYSFYVNQYVRLRRRGIYHTRYRTLLIIFRVFKNAFRGFHIAYVPRGKTPYFFPSRWRDFRECGVCVQSHDSFGNSIEGNTDMTLSIPSKRFRRLLSLSDLTRLTPSEGN